MNTNGIGVGLALILMGLLFVFGRHLPFVGHLPGDFEWQLGSARVMVPLGKCVVASVVLTILLRLFGR
jgi:hypothetical protein